MQDIKWNKLYTVLGLVVLILFFIAVVYTLPKIEAAYDWISVKIPVLGRFLEWAREITS